MKNDIKKLLLAGLGCYAMMNVVVAEEARKWVNKDGRSMIAKLERVEDKHVNVLIDGKSYRVAIEALSSKDQTYIKQWGEKKNKSTTTATEGEELNISKRGKLLYETNFKNNDGWRVSSGSWVCKDNEVTASQTGKGHKGHIVIRNPQPVNVIIECEILLLEARAVGFTIDDKPDKLGMANFSANGFGGKALHRVKNPPIKKSFKGIKIPLKRDEWHHVTIEMIGNKISISSNGHESESVDNMWAGKPKRLGLRVDGGPSKYRNLKMWEALPKDE